jgi:hypothetical protein
MRGICDKPTAGIIRGVKKAGSREIGPEDMG